MSQKPNILVKPCKVKNIKELSPKHHDVNILKFK